LRHNKGVRCEVIDLTTEPADVVAAQGKSAGVAMTSDASRDPRWLRGFIPS
jgi:hypothetical protein